MQPDNTKQHLAAISYEETFLMWEGSTGYFAQWKNNSSLEFGSGLNSHRLLRRDGKSWKVLKSIEYFKQLLAKLAKRIGNWKKRNTSFCWKLYLLTSYRSLFCNQRRIKSHSHAIQFIHGNILQSISNFTI